MGVRVRLSLVLVLGVVSAPLGAQQFTTFPGWAHDVTPDGAVLVGQLPSGEACYWRWQVDPAPVPIGG